MDRPDPEQETPEEVERIADAAGGIRDAWQRTLEDARAMVADREEAGYETFLAVSQDTSPVAPDTGREAWGLTYLLDGDTAEEFAAARDRAAFDETGVYQAVAGDSTFIVTECIDHDAELVVFLVGAFRVREATELVRAALDRGEMHSHVRLLDGTVVASIDHEDAESFFPNPGQYIMQGGSRQAPGDDGTDEQ